MRIAHLSLSARFLRRHLAATLLLPVLALAPVAAPAAPAEPLPGPVTGLPLPRFVSLKADTVNVRRGPSREHMVEWVYKRRGLPVEIIGEFDRWRRIRDADGETGWVYHSLLDGERTVLLHGRGEIPLLAEPQSSAIVALAEPGVVARLETCRTGYCRLSAKGHTGWVDQRSIWGVTLSDMRE